MFKNKLWTLAMVTICGASLLLTPAISEAQRGRGGRGGGWSGGRGAYYGGRGWYGGGWYGGIGLGYPYLGWGYGYPGYSYGDGYYSGPSYSYGDPGYSYAQPNYTYSTPQSYQSNYPAMTQATDPNTAGFMVRVPDPNAQIWFDNYQTKQRGTVRQFTAGAMDPSQSYAFHIRARWTDPNGRVVDQTREVTARAGQQMTVDFMNPNTGQQ